MFESFIGIIFQNYGMVGVGALVAALGVIKWSSALLNIIKKINPFKNKTNYIPRDILYSKLSYWLDFKIGNINIVDLGRRLIFKDLLYYKFESLRDTLFDIEDREGFGSWDGPTFYKEILKCVTHNTLAYEFEATRNGIPPVVVTKFKRWHSGTLDFLLKSAELISASTVYKNNHERMQAIYTVYTAMLEILINEAEKTLTELNGELTGVEYKGVVCG